MDESTLKYLFLSASIPVPGRDEEKYLNTSDVISIRDSVIALVSASLPKYHLVWGGHPSISPLIVNVLRHSKVNINDHLTLYQSKQYAGMFPEENREVGNIVYTDKGSDIDESLYLMRHQMLTNHQYVAGFFIGGMKGVEIEYQMFSSIYPNAQIIPVSTTGAAAKIIFDQNRSQFDPRLEFDLSYFSLFKDILNAL